MPKHIIACIVCNAWCTSAFGVRLKHDPRAVATAIRLRLPWLKQVCAKLLRRRNMFVKRYLEEDHEEEEEDEEEEGEGEGEEEDT